MKLSIIVCSYNRANYLVNSVRKLCEQNCDFSLYEIIVVDNNSTDDTFRVCQEAIEKYSNNNLTYVQEKNQGLTFARNRGIRESNGELISFIDDDGFAEKNYVQEIISAFERYPASQAMGGKVIPIFPECDPPKWVSKYIDGILSKLDLGEKEKAFDEKYPVGCNMIFRKQILDKMGGFNENIVLRSDEKDLFLRINKTGSEITYVPSIRVEHVISKNRVEKEGVIRISKITGEGEFYRNKTSRLSLLKKLLEYLFKMGASLLIYLFFLVRGETQKAHYVVLVRYYILIGFLSSKRTFNSGV